MFFSHYQFQSTPPAEARGDAWSPAQFLATISFNPLPPPKRGETVLGLRQASGRRCFNPLPPPKRGETSAIRAVPKSMPDIVSIHSPRRSEGRRFGSIIRVAKYWFQSTPPAEARGDVLDRW